MRWDFLVLGSSGIQGVITAKTLLDKGYSVLLSDLYKEESLRLLAKYSPDRVSFRGLDVRNKKKLLSLIKSARPKVLINCVEADYNLLVYQACLKAEINVIDLGSDIPMTEKQMQMHDEFVSIGRTAITGCGSTPGINNVMVEHASRDLDNIDTIEAGFAWDSNIKCFVPPFSIRSILEELQRPAVYLEDGKWREVKHPLDNLVRYQFRSIGSQQCMLIGEHAEPHTFYERYKLKGIKNIRFYGSFPRHSLNTLKMLLELGLGNDERVSVSNKNDMHDVSPLDVLAQTLRRLPKPNGYKETEILWAIIEGKKGRKKVRTEMECVVHTRDGWEEASCNIDTGITAGIMAMMIERGEIGLTGSFSPEQCIQPAVLFRRLARYGMKVYKDGRRIN